jgi:hypothetical protein
MSAQVASRAPIVRWICLYMLGWIRGMLRFSPRETLRRLRNGNGPYSPWPTRPQRSSRPLTAFYVQFDACSNTLAEEWRDQERPRRESNSWHLYTLIIALGTAATIMTWQLPDFPKIVANYSRLHDDSIYYLLSSQAQLLAAILALLVASAVTAGALATRYTWRAIEQVVGLWLVFYIIPYAAGLILPIALLYYRFNLTMVRTSMIIMVVCILLIGPFVWQLRDQLNMINIIAGMGRKTRQQYRHPKPAWKSVPSEATVGLLDVAYAAYSVGDFATFRFAVNQVGILINLLLRTRSGDDVILPILDQLTNLARTVNESALNPAIRTTRTLHHLGVTAIDRGRYESLLHIITSLSSAGRAAVRSHWGHGAEQIARAMYCVGKELVDKQVNSSEEIPEDRAARLQANRTLISAVANVGVSLTLNPPADVDSILPWFYECIFQLRSINSENILRDVVTSQPKGSVGDGFYSGYEQYARNHA